MAIPHFPGSYTMLISKPSNLNFLKGVLQYVQDPLTGILQLSLKQLQKNQRPQFSALFSDPYKPPSIHSSQIVNKDSREHFKLANGSACRFSNNHFL